VAQSRPPAQPVVTTSSGSQGSPSAPAPRPMQKPERTIVVELPTLSGRRCKRGRMACTSCSKHPPLAPSACLSTSLRARAREPSVHWLRRAGPRHGIARSAAPSAGQSAAFVQDSSAPPPARAIDRVRPPGAAADPCCPRPPVVAACQPVAGVPPLDDACPPVPPLVPVPPELGAPPVVACPPSPLVPAEGSPPSVMTSPAAGRHRPRPPLSLGAAPARPPADCR
jgi:hypothetical protein